MRKRKVYEVSAIDSNSSIKEIKKMMESMVVEARKRGHFVAASNLKDYLRGRKSKKKIKSSWLRQFQKVKRAEKDNETRFQRDLLREINNLKEGRHKNYSDYYDRLISFHGRGYSTQELFYASGNSTLTTTGSFRIEIKNGKAFIKGKLHHRWHDEYNWHVGLRTIVPGYGLIADADIKRLEHEDKARAYKMYSEWYKYLNTSFDTRLPLGRFSWSDGV